MPTFDDEEFAIAKVYSTAMLDLAYQAGEADSLGKELADLAALIDRDEDLAAYLTSPTVEVDARRSTIEKAFRGRAGDLLVDSLQVLNRNRRLGLLCAVAETFRLADEERRGRVEVHVRTAVPLSKRLRARLAEVFSKRTGRETDLVESVDESLIGGVVVQVGDEKFDTSVTRRLATMCEGLLDRASREIHGDKEYVVGGAE